MFTVLQAIAVYEDHHVLPAYAAIVQNVAAGFGFCGEHHLQGLGYGADGDPYCWALNVTLDVFGERNGRRVTG